MQRARHLRRCPSGTSGLSAHFQPLRSATRCASLCQQQSKGSTHQGDDSTPCTHSIRTRYHCHTSSTAASAAVAAVAVAVATAMKDCRIDNLVAGAARRGAAPADPVIVAAVDVLFPSGPICGTTF
eukprot:1052532-Pleurochrysis_carterae.AAC.1